MRIMDALAGHGVVTGGWESTCTDTELTGETIRAAGVACDPTGISGGEIITTNGLVGSGPTNTSELVGTGTGTLSTVAGLAPVGSGFAATGVCIAAMHTITGIMVVSSGVGADSDELASTDIVCERSTATTRATGDECVPTGTCGSVAITTANHVGAGELIEESVTTCIGSVSSAAGQVLAGSS